MFNKNTRKALLEAYNYKCQYCGEQEATHIDHLYPRAAGGGDELENLIPACGRCNIRKNAHVFSESSMIFYKEIILKRLPSVKKKLLKLEDRKPPQKKTKLKRKKKLFPKKEDFFKATLCCSLSQLSWLPLYWGWSEKTKEELVTAFEKQGLPEPFLEIDYCIGENTGLWRYRLFTDPSSAKVLEFFGENMFELKKSLESQETDNCLYRSWFIHDTMPNFKDFYLTHSDHTPYYEKFIAPLLNSLR